MSSLASSKRKSLRSVDPLPAAGRAVTLRLLGPADAASYQALRLDGLARHGCEFAASYEEEAGLPLAAFEQRLASGTVFGGFVAGHLVGVAGFRQPPEAKKRHKGVLWGVYVAPSARRLGLGRALVRAVIEHARGRVLQLHATVASLNTAARALYLAEGFRPYGCEPQALHHGGRYYDQDLLLLPLGAPAAPGGAAE